MNRQLFKIDPNKVIEKREELEQKYEDSLHPPYRLRYEERYRDGRDSFKYGSVRSLPEKVRDEARDVCYFLKCGQLINGKMFKLTSAEIALLLIDWYKTKVVQWNKFSKKKQDEFLKDAVAKANWSPPKKDQQASNKARSKKRSAEIAEVYNLYIEENGVAPSRNKLAKLANCSCHTASKFLKSLEVEHSLPTILIEQSLNDPLKEKNVANNIVANDCFTPKIIQCTRCHDDIQFLRSVSGGLVPIEADDTLSVTDLYNANKHRCHIPNCGIDTSIDY